MTIEELVAKCRESEYVILALPPPLGKGYTRRLAGKQGPRGEILCGVEGSHQTVRFLSAAILRYLRRKGLVTEAGGLHNKGDEQ